MIHTHLEDYHSPLDYTPLCYGCHMTVHRRYKEPEGFIAWFTLVANGWTPRPHSVYGSFMGEYAWAKRQPLGIPDAHLDPWILSLPMIEPDLYGRGPEPAQRPDRPVRLRGTP